MKSKQLPSQLVKVFRVQTKAVTPTDADMNLIRPFLLREFGPEDIYIREMHLANDQPDRQFEQFDVGYLQRFAETAHGKSVLVGHDYGNAPIGRFFDARVERAKSGWNWLVQRFYMPVSDGNKLERDNIDAGVWSYVSIGAAVDWGGLVCNICSQPYYPWYAAEAEANCPHYAGESYEGGVCVPVYTTERSDMSKVEEIEGSVVFLGAQYDAAISKTAETAGKAQESKRLYLADNTPPDGGELEGTMELEQLKQELAAKTEECAALAAKVADLEPLAEIGKSLKADLVAEVKRLAACVGDGSLIETLIDETTDVEKLRTLHTDYAAKWAAKNPAAPQSEPGSPDVEPGKTSAPDMRAHSLI